MCPPLLPIILAIFILNSNPLLAGAWKISPSISVSELYTDNVSLTTPGLAEEEFVTEISPGLSVTGAGKRVQGGFNYRLQTLSYFKENKRNNIFHQFQSDVIAELARELLFLDLSASNLQKTIDPEGRAGTNLNAISTNRTGATTVRISPYLRHVIAQDLETELRYTKSWVEYDNVQGANNRSEQILASLGNNLKKGKTLEWDLNYRSDKNIFSNTGNVEFNTASIDLMYSLRARVKLLAEGGYERNSFESSSPLSDQEGTIWNVGIAWIPSSRSFFEAKLGERFFGKTYSLKLQNRWRRTMVTLDYTEDVVTNASRSLLKPDTVDGLVEQETNTSLLNNEVFLRQRSSVNIDVSLAKSNLLFEVFNEQRKFQLTLEKEKNFGGRVLWNWPLSLYNQISLNALWNRVEFRGTDNEYKHKGIGINLTSQLGRSLSSMISYNYTKRDAKNINNSYAENRVGVKATWTF